MNSIAASESTGSEGWDKGIRGLSPVEGNRREAPVAGQ